MNDCNEAWGEGFMIKNSELVDGGSCDCCASVERVVRFTICANGETDASERRIQFCGRCQKSFARRADILLGWNNADYVPICAAPSQQTPPHEDIPSVDHDAPPSAKVDESSARHAAYTAAVPPGVEKGQRWKIIGVIMAEGDGEARSKSTYFEGPFKEGGYDRAK